uniref:Uncharacterized protein n=1 Tax=Terrapene triunguis TaxID=2587831 RepID=A0A674I1E5_9SAUR
TSEGCSEDSGFCVCLLVSCTARVMPTEAWKAVFVLPEAATKTLGLNSVHWPARYKAPLAYRQLRTIRDDCRLHRACTVAKFSKLWIIVAFIYLFSHLDIDFILIAHFSAFQWECV